MNPTLVLFLSLAVSEATADLAGRLEPLVSILNGQRPRFGLRLEADFPLNRQPQRLVVVFRRWGDEAMSVSVDYPGFPLELRRQPDRCVLLLKAHATALVGEGPASGPDVLAPSGLGLRLIGEGCRFRPWVQVLAHSPAEAATVALVALAGLQPAPDAPGAWTSPWLQRGRLRFAEDGTALEVTQEDVTVRLQWEEPTDPATTRPAVPPTFQVVAVDRAELERLIVRALRRAAEILAPAPSLLAPSQQPRTVAHGRLQWQHDLRLVLLEGTPAEIGRAHGLLLAQPARRVLDSTVYLVGLYDTIRTGRWFLQTLREAYARLQRFIPPDHQAELEALADAAGISREEARLANIFPELFHCSGFALFGRATVHGKLYHGRVLDYMTQIGLQDGAAVFIVAPRGKIAFANIGYAGFIGSVSGMNARGLSLGEMGGRGEGRWDGTPMATLMRRGLEECATLEEVQALWRRSPRTCEYFYVFADAKGPAAVGVAATPEHVEFIQPGQSHPRLGQLRPDTVLMSAGGRLDVLRQRVEAAYGRLDAEQAMRLMDRPVAMAANLHNVLFVPQDLTFYVAHADRRTIAAQRPYVRFDLGHLLGTLATQPGPSRPD